MEIQYDPIKKVVKTIDNTKIVSKCFGQTLFERLKKYAGEGRTFQILMDNGTEDSYKDFLSRCLRMAVFMKDSGVKPGDIISTCTDNHINSYVPIIAAAFIGAIPASTDPIQSYEDTKHLVNVVEPKMFFVSKECVEMIEKCIKTLDIECEIVPFEIYGTYKHFEQVMREYEDNEDVNEDNFEPYVNEDLNSPAMIFFTSGTTGLPKAAILGQHMVLECFSWIEAPNLRLFNVSGTYWSSSIFVLFLSCAMGFTVCVTKEFDPKTFWDKVDEYEVNIGVLNSTRTAESLKYLNSPKENLMEFVVMGGQMPYEFTQELKEKLPECHVRNQYGSTEVGLITQYPKCNKPKSVGLPVLNGQTIKVVDPDTEENLGFNEPGEIRIKSDHQFSGYYKLDSTDYRDSEGFYKTGDMGYFDEDFYFYVVDRIKDIFKYRNWHISPIIIENVLCSHEAVDLAICIGLPHPVDGNHPMAVVVLKENAQVIEEDLLKFANGKLDELNQIRAGLKVVQRSDLPYTPTDKIKRKVLKDLILSKKI